MLLVWFQIGFQLDMYGHIWEVNILINVATRAKGSWGQLLTAGQSEQNGPLGQWALKRQELRRVVSDRGWTEWLWRVSKVISYSLFCFITVNYAKIFQNPRKKTKYKYILTRKYAWCPFNDNTTLMIVVDVPISRLCPDDYWHTSVIQFGHVWFKCWKKPVNLQPLSILCHQRLQRASDHRQHSISLSLQTDLALQSSGYRGLGNHSNHLERTICSHPTASITSQMYTSNTFFFF